MCVCPITVSVSVLCIFSFLYRLSFGDDWTEFLFSLYADHTLIQCAGLPTATFSITQFCLRGAGAAATIALTSDRSAGQLQLRRKEGRGRGGWLEREREG